MLSTMAKMAVAGCAIYKIYRKAEKVMKNDEEYLMRITGYTRGLAERMIDEAKKHSRDKEYELSAEYFYYAYKYLDSSWEYVVTQIDSQEVYKLLHAKKSQDK
ncbi:hypothetical protein EROM_040880 [Encephalitozoon romaleae SJ-2008]|uniref:Uncharacterized protein n=1 Tax=Encephalitozoon romaleae (strain SJ-2008) TaxID=1178016 RepID=I7AE12_ENCRO|nr:hypothetical protein EROM_040880 [Encephalitozoon romaleae SJ-2008]AFN82855.1 hypothetical protein EROM_040880 [Encephalitozoon romaleae SJ-2008]